MKLLPKTRDFLFRCRYLFKGVPREIGGHSIRVDESLRRWSLDCEPIVSELLNNILKRGDVMLDIGANFGLHTLQAASLVGSSGKVIAFEPIPSNLKLLRRNITVNGFSQCVEIYSCAVSNDPQKYLEMVLPENEVAVTASLAVKSDVGRKCKVSNVRLDDLEFSNIRMIKIDVEGAEMEVLKGARCLIEKERPIILIEIHEYALPDFGSSSQELVNFLLELGYTEERLEEVEYGNSIPYHSLFRIIS